ncbi:alpha/beta hydrolase [Bacillaceae bacterium W0354]
MKKKKKWIIISLIIFTLLFAVNIIASNFFYNLAIKREVKTFLADNDDLVVSAEAMDVFLKGDWRDWFDQKVFELWEIESFDGLKLQGYYLEAEEPTNKTVIFAHGYLGRGRDMALYGQHYYEDLGYNVFTADMRGHGKSEGDYIGFGWHDRLDYLQWIDKIIKRQGPDTEIVLHGLSMGASTVLMVSGEDMPEQVKAIVADSPFTSTYDLFKYQMERMYHLPAFPILPTTSLVTQIRADYSLYEASALKQVEHAKVPILYFHGDADTFVPTEMAMELYEHTNSEAELMTFENASHGEAFVIHREQYLNKLHQFLNKYIH